MNDIVEFLLARLGEDEAVALGVVNADGETYAAEWTEPLTGTIEIGDEWPLVVGDRRLSNHIARWDPARVLAEVEAKRAIVLMAERTARESDDYPGWEGAALHLAQPYADHPDFDPAWRTVIVP